MMSVEAIEKLMTASIEDSVVGVMDLTGTSDHFEVRVSSGKFRGKSLIEQHQMVNQALREPLGDGRIHALTIKTVIPPQ